ncbi:NAD(P)/FAD-dependent oxidoreductase [Litorimonas sp. WD9-15]|uniref:NAD(P)/FAD-dependent oxidoreductase n=1 Tax=Litorimonas sp. WD9-15 TaxID=3418716 RepID=UPI003CFD8A7D
MDYDVVIIGAGAAGMMCGAVAGRRGKSVVLLDHAKKPGEKIRISGGGRCNFTNLYCGPENFISENEHFAKSALARYTQWDFIGLVEKYDIKWHEKTKGQLFCDNSSQQIIDMLVEECEDAGNEFRLDTEVMGVEKLGDGFAVTTPTQTIACANVVMACGGPSIPKMGATGFGYKIAEQFGLNIVRTEPALVPLTFTDQLKEPIAALSGMSVDARITNDRATFDEALLFTHRGLSGPAVLQISSYWRSGEAITVDMNPGRDTLTELREAKDTTPKLSPEKWLNSHIPARLAAHLAQGINYTRLADMPDREIQNLALQVSAWHIRPAGTEGYRKAEVTRGGVDTDELSSKTMEAKSVSGLYFIGEVVDVTGHLGGHNFQWAWASGVACGEAI